jgi:CDP-paratose 2-epimerase
MIVGVAQSGRLYSEFMGREKMALVTGSGGLIGSECARVLCQQGWNVVGIDNDMRSWFFGEVGSTAV